MLDFLRFFLTTVIFDLFAWKYIPFKQLICQSCNNVFPLHHQDFRRAKLCTRYCLHCAVNSLIHKALVKYKIWLYLEDYIENNDKLFKLAPNKAFIVFILQNSRETWELVQSGDDPEGLGLF